MTAPGLGGEMGATLGDTAREFYQGLFLAPHIVIQAVKTAILQLLFSKGWVMLLNRCRKNVAAILFKQLLWKLNNVCAISA